MFEVVGIDSLTVMLVLQITDGLEAVAVLGMFNFFPFIH